MLIDAEINRIYDGVDAETRKSQASFQIFQVSSEALPVSSEALPISSEALPRMRLEWSENEPGFTCRGLNAITDYISHPSISVKSFECSSKQ